MFNKIVITISIIFNILLLAIFGVVYYQVQKQEVLAVPFVYPNGGQHLKLGDKQDLYWVAPKFFFRAKISLADSNNASLEWFISDVSAILPGTQKFTWTVGDAAPFVNVKGNPLPGTYLFFICEPKPEPQGCVNGEYSRNPVVIRPASIQ